MNGNKYGKSGNTGSSSSKSTGIAEKKATAYPIKGQLRLPASGSAMAMAIVKLTEIGFLAEVPPSGVKAGEKFECSFEIPVNHHPISTSLTLIKIYNQTTVQLLEMHFVALLEADRKQILNFLRSIN
jgi:hypothetical protein